MRQLFLEGKYLVSLPIEKCSSMVQKALNELGFKKVTMKREVSPRYLLAECDLGWGHGKREIEFVFKDRQKGSEVSFKWPYGSEFPSHLDGKQERLYTSLMEGRKQEAERLIEEFKSRIGATDIPVAEEEKVHEKEVIKEKEVIVKVRCTYCNKLYDETLNICPHCGGNR